MLSYVQKIVYEVSNKTLDQRLRLQRASNCIQHESEFIPKHTHHNSHKHAKKKLRKRQKRTFEYTSK